MYSTKNPTPTVNFTFREDKDPTAASRKQDHIDLAFQSQIQQSMLDKRFYYEPMLAAHPKKGANDLNLTFLGKTMLAPIWISSMTGGTTYANIINHNLAKACNEFGLGMGLGSCRSLLYSDEYLADFDVRKDIGDAPLFANLGIAQIEILIKEKEIYRLKELMNKLQADGLIIHVNPMQEWLQPEGDRFEQPPLETIKYVIEHFDFPIIVKEVGQGMGYESLKALFQLPLAAIDFAAHGGTNFAKLELLRSNQEQQNWYNNFALIGHSAEEMVLMTNKIIAELGEKCLSKEVIVSGGVKTFLDGYYYINKIKTTAVYGQASAMLRHARGDYETLQQFIIGQIEGLNMAKTFLKVR